MLVFWVIVTAIENKDFPIRGSGAYTMAFRYIVIALFLSITAAISYFYFADNTYSWISTTFRVIFALMFIFNSLIAIAYIIHRIKIKWQYELTPYPSDLKNITNIVIKSFEFDRPIQLSDQQINEFLGFLKKGRMFESIKTMTHFEIKITADDEIHTYYFHYDAIGPNPGGLTQIVFRPKKKGLLEFLKEIECGYNSALSQNK